LKAEWRCLVPATSFCEWTDSRPKVARWFALDESCPLFAFAGIWRLWTGERKGESGEHSLFAFLTTQSNDVARPIHAKAMPVLHTKPEEWDVWLDASVNDAITLQRLLPNEFLRIVAKREKSDKPPVDEERWQDRWRITSWRDGATSSSWKSGFCILEIFPKVSKNRHFLSRYVLGHWDAWQLNYAAFDGVHEREVANRPWERGAFSIAGAAKEEWRRGEINDPADAEQSVHGPNRKPLDRSRPAQGHPPGRKASARIAGIQTQSKCRATKNPWP
jgi:SOS response associated peptidase (SRAP)